MAAKRKKPGVRPVISLIYEDWPKADKAAFRKAFPKNDPAKRAAIRRAALAKRLYAPKKARVKSLSEATVRNQKQALERIQGFFRRTCPEVFGIAFAERFRHPVMLKFPDDFRVGIKPQTIADTLERARAALEIIAPEKNFEHLHEIALSVPNRSPRSNKPAPTVHSDDLLEAALMELDRLRPLIEAVATAPSNNEAARSPRLRYRDALIVAILTADPLRLKNFLGLTLGETFQVIAQVGFEIVIPREDMKTRAKSHRRKLPQDLNGYVRFYLNSVRPMIAQTIDDGSLWIGISGQRLSRSQCHDIVTATTKRLVGERLTAQNFRHLSVDLIARLGLPLEIAKRAIDHSDGSPLTERVYTHVKRQEGFNLLGHLMSKNFDRLADEPSETE